MRGDHLLAVGTNVEIRALATAETAVVDAAYASFEESRKGPLAAGKLADFVVLSEDIFSAPPDRILKTKVLLTVMGGRETYRAAIFP
ncbi:MAG TPA: amidohydrolase family protein [Candidatus Acidoferrum sp.]